MRRGFELEAELNRLSKYLNANGIHMHKNHPRRTEQGAYLEGEPFDYEVISDGIIHCFDAKECSGNSWDLRNVKINQLNNLLACQKNGAQAYFLVWFRKVNELVRIDAETVKEALTNGQKSMMPEEGRQWNWTELLTSKRNTAS